MPLTRKAIASIAGKASWTKGGFTPARDAALRKARKIRAAMFKSGQVPGLYESKTAASKAGAFQKGVKSLSNMDYMKLQKKADTLAQAASKGPVKPSTVKNWVKTVRDLQKAGGAK